MTKLTRQQLFERELQLNHTAAALQQLLDTPCRVQLTHATLQHCLRHRETFFALINHGIQGSVADGNNALLKAALVAKARTHADVLNWLLKQSCVLNAIAAESHTTAAAPHCTCVGCCLPRCGRYTDAITAESRQALISAGLPDRCPNTRKLLLLHRR
jgi:hypothetical protein